MNAFITILSLVINAMAAYLILSQRADIAAGTSRERRLYKSVPKRRRPSCLAAEERAVRR